MKTGVAIVGCGVVGAQVVRILAEKRADIAGRAGVEVAIRHVIVRDAVKPRPEIPAEVTVSSDYRAAIADDQTHIVVELIGGTEVARDVVLAALNAGKSVVSANKALVAAHGPELFAAARANGVCLVFEGAVGGGIPVLDALRRGLVANDIEAIYAILNGTCNFILTQMVDERLTFESALKQAQKLGFAEADPTLDIDGSDTVQKLAILILLAMRQKVNVADIPTVGIEAVELTDLIAGRELGYVCKLLAIAKTTADGVLASVRPTFIADHHPLAKIDGPFNAVSFYGDAVGHVLLAGRGAGGGPTASAVVADIVDVASGNAQRSFDATFSQMDLATTQPVLSGDRWQSPYYLRVNIEDKPGGVADVSRILADEQVSIASLVQHVPAEKTSTESVPVVIMTHVTSDDAVRRAVQKISALASVQSTPICIPVVDEHEEFNGTA